MKFPGQKPAAMSSELDRRFGSHDTQENEVSIPGKRVCTGAGQFIQCVDVPPSKRTEIFYKWAKDGLVVSTSDVNTASFDVSVTYEAYAKVKAYRAEAAALKQQPKPPVSQPNTGRGF
jgi:hypothetical protein